MNRRRAAWSHRAQPALVPLALALLALAAPVSPASAASAAAAAAPAKATGGLTFDALFAKDAFGRAPAQYAWSPDGRRLAFVFKDEAGAEAIWSLDAASGRRERLLALADLQGKDGAKLDLDGYQWSPKGDALLLSAGGELDLLPIASRRLARLTAAGASHAAAPEDPRFSPDGARLAFVRGEDLYLLDLASGKERALTEGGRENEILRGKVDWVYGEEIWNRHPQAFWWSPDGARIAYYEFDERPVESYPIVDYSPRYPTVAWQKYPKAGEPNPRVRVGVLDVASGVTTWMGTGGEEGDYLARVDWAPDGKWLAIQRLNREQTQLDLLRCQAADGLCAAALTETHRTWVNLGDDFRFLQDGRMIRGSETSGWRRLYLYDSALRAAKPLSPQGWAVTSLDGVVEEGGGRGYALATGFAVPIDGGSGILSPIERQVMLLPLDGGSVKTLAGDPGWNEVGAAAEKTGNWVHTWSDADHPPRAEVRRADGSRLAELPSGPPAFDPAKLQRWEFVTIDGPDGVKLPARLLKPAGFAPARRYPALVFHYGGPGSQQVKNQWNLGSAWQKMMAERGYVSFTVDNRSSLFFGKAGEDRDHRRMSNGNLDAQLAGVEHLKHLGYVDGSRLGLWGWSGGGSNTLYCVFNAPGVWKAAVAGAPVTDWTLYDTIWTERYLDRPQDNPQGYKDSSAITYARRLKDHLLIVHGLADDNVHPQNTVNLTDKLIAAGIPFEEAVYPHQKHGFKPESSRHFYERMTGFFDRWLE
jgi:dipeptidyl-peptidase-4